MTEQLPPEVRAMVSGLKLIDEVLFRPRREPLRQARTYTIRRTVPGTIEVLVGDGEHAHPVEHVPLHSPTGMETGWYTPSQCSENVANAGESSDSRNTSALQSEAHAPVPTAEHASPTPDTCDGRSAVPAVKASETEKEIVTYEQRFAVNSEESARSADTPDAPPRSTFTMSTAERKSVAGGERTLEKSETIQSALPSSVQIATSKSMHARGCADLAASILADYYHLTPEVVVTTWKKSWGLDNTDAAKVIRYHQLVKEHFVAAHKLEPGEYWTLTDIELCQFLIKCNEHIGAGTVEERIPDAT